MAVIVKLDELKEAWKKNPIPADGHTIYKPEYYTEKGYPEDFVKSQIQIFKSDGTTKGSIHKDGVYVEETKGIYNLTFLYTLAETIEADTKEASSKIGRGFQAQCLVEAINKKLGD